MDREATKCAMGISHYSQDFNKQNSFQFSLGIEVVIPIEIGLPTMQIKHYNESSNLIQLRANLNLLEETWDKAHIYIAIYWQQVTRYITPKWGQKPSTLEISFCTMLKFLDQLSKASCLETRRDLTGYQKPYIEKLNRTLIPETRNAENLWMYYQWCIHSTHKWNKFSPTRSFGSPPIHRAMWPTSHRLKLRWVTYQHHTYLDD